jgi:hypothetical protein
MGLPLFSLDILLAACVLGLSWRWGWFALLAVYAMDGTWFLSQTYHFANAIEFVGAGRFLNLLGIADAVSLPAVLLAIAVFAMPRWASRFRNRTPSPGWVFVLLLAIACADVLNGSTRLFRLGDDANRLNVNVAGSPLANQMSLWIGRAMLSREPIINSREHGLYDRARGWVSDRSPRGVLLVLVESMGEPASPRTRTWLHAQLASGLGVDPTSAAIVVGTEVFSGPTTYGELRSLCALNGHYTHLSNSQITRCLPALAREHGRTALAFHGFSLRMFERDSWWPRLGFEAAALNKVPQNQMGCNQVYKGVCDATLLEMAVRSASRPGVFVYAVTLDTHLPLSRTSEPLDPRLLSACQAEAVSDQACNLISKTGAILKLLGRLLATLPESQRPRLIAAGDHAPPFLAKRDRDAFEASRVPVFSVDPDRD